MIKADVEKELYAYLGGILKQNKSVPIAINGIENHVHILCIMSKNTALADLLEELKRNSSRWIKTKGTDYIDFAWQGGYGGFSVSQSKVDVVKRYIENQKEHHKKETFKEEYIRFLKEYDVDFNEDYLWTISTSYKKTPQYKKCIEVFNINKVVFTSESLLLFQ